ncbi:hypothetical protein GQ457_01G032410 [Hibiscus cannabinus]
MPNHPTEYCPILQEETSELVYGVGNFLGPPQRPYDPYNNTYNSGWRDHLNLSYVKYPRSYPTYQPYQPPKSSLEELVERLEDRIELHCQKIDKQLSRLGELASRIELHGKLPSQTKTNPREDVSTITLRSETVIEQPTQEKHDTKKSTSVIEASGANSQKEGDATTQKRNSTPEPIQSPHIVQPPFPLRPIKEDKRAEEKEILDVFRKVEINLPLLEVIQKMPRYAHFFKELYANTRKLSEQEKVNLGEKVSAVLTRWFSPKLKNQDMFATPRKIHKISLKEVLSWTKGKKMEYFS